ncbi:hypothetical protein [Marinobacter xestospongiae]|uniref:hypothetical protein n=1 Tax=Marinobacter xestospongiae TaxID=994319 RepID=UPI002005B302|nr:hypothetical protein [Marinobacter xestospongiae]MCK7565851.1 hypothetical protein [Marinobacter xestospongiae]
MSSYNYSELTLQKTADLPKIVGLSLEKVLVNYVADEINVLYLKAGGRWFAAQPEIGGEILGFRELGVSPIEGATSDVSGIMNCALFERFTGAKVTAVRQMGEAWNGHGFEVSFYGIVDHTLLVQSIHTGSEAEDYSDCLRLGVGSYVHVANSI